MRSMRAVVDAMRAVLPSKDGFELVYIEQATGAFDHALVDFIKCRASLEEEIAAVLKLVARILVAKPRAALFFDIEAKAQTARINPTLTDLGQPPYSVVLTQGVCDLVQGLVGTTHKAVTLLNHRDGLLAGAAFDPFVSVEHHLHAKGRMTTHLDGEMSPLFVDEVKVVVIDVRPGLAGFQMRHLALATCDLPHQGGRLGHQNEKKAGKVRIFWQMLFGEPVLAFSSGAVDKRQAVGFGIVVDPSAKSSRHAYQMLLVEALIGAGQIAPPTAKTASAVAARKIAVNYDAIDTVIAPLQGVTEIVREVIVLFHAKDAPISSGHDATAQSASFSKRSLGKSVDTGFAEAYNNLAFTLRKQGSANFQKSLAYYNKAIQLKPKLAEAYMYRGVLYT